jgi:hypothetical protein
MHVEDGTAKGPFPCVKCGASVWWIPVHMLNYVLCRKHKDEYDASQDSLWRLKHGG